MRTVFEANMRFVPAQSAEAQSCLMLCTGRRWEALTTLGYQGLLQSEIKVPFDANYPFDTLPRIDCFAFNAEIICLGLQNKRVAARG